MSVTTQVPYVNHTLTRLNEVVRILRLYFPDVKTYIGQRALGAADSDGPVKIPCFMVEALSTSAVMDRVQKYDRRFTFAVYFYVDSTNRDDVVQKQTAYMESLAKLFSNNGSGTGQGYGIGGYGSGTYGDFVAGAFKNNAGFWWNSEIKAMTYSAAYIHPERKGAFIRAGRFELEVRDSIIE